jgi:nucleotide-binding universal stress UspA family protein
MLDSSTTSSSMIAVGVDGSPSSTAALVWAARQAHATRASLQVITSWRYPRAYGFDVALTDDWRPDQAASRAQADAVAAAAGELENIVVEKVLVEDEPGQALVTASKEVDLLVVGSRGHGELAGMLIGSVSEYCAAHADCPVVVVRRRQASLAVI